MMRPVSIRNAQGRAYLIAIDGTPRQLSRLARIVQEMGFICAQTTPIRGVPTVRPSRALRIVRGK